MPLTRKQPIGYDVEHMSFRFTMMSDDLTVQCNISTSALKELCGNKNFTAGRCASVFLQFRERIEQVASEIFDSPERTLPIRVFAKHIRYP
jgi:hypothetical protein